MRHNFSIRTKNQIYKAAPNSSSAED